MTEYVTMHELQQRIEKLESDFFALKNQGLDHKAQSALQVEIKRLEAEMQAWKAQHLQSLRDENEQLRAASERLRAAAEAWKARALSGSDANREVVSPMDFGAVPDLVSDCQTAPAGTLSALKDMAEQRRIEIKALQIEQAKLVDGYNKLASERDKESAEVTRLSDLLREMQAERDLLRERLLRMESARWEASVKAEQLMVDLRLDLFPVILGRGK